MLAVLILAYAILRHQLLDIDVKLKWTIKRGTLAGMFLAVFFVASQVAQNYFSQSYGVLAGGAAAGLLLFAIAPLQRVAERVADAAMPGVGQPTHAGTLAAAGVVPADPGTLVRKEDAYRGALRVALADRRMSPEEEIALARVAEELGLGAARAVELRIQVERETIRTTRGSRLRR